MLPLSFKWPTISHILSRCAFYKLKLLPGLLLLTNFTAIAQVRDLSPSAQGGNRTAGLAQQDSKKAIEEYKNSLLQWRASGDIQREAITLNNIGYAYYQLGEKQKALDYYNQALKLSNGGRIEAATLSNIGAIYYSLGDKQMALDYLGRALTLFQASGNRQAEAYTLSSIGQVYYSLGDEQKALNFFSRALLIKKNISNSSTDSANQVSGDLKEIPEIDALQLSLRL